jgi:hypothetical protein
LLKSALALTDDLISQAKLPAAAILGSKGSIATAKWGTTTSASWPHGARSTAGAGREKKLNEKFTQ